MQPVEEQTPEVAPVEDTAQETAPEVEAAPEMQPMEEEAAAEMEPVQEPVAPEVAPMEEAAQVVAPEPPIEAAPAEAAPAAEAPAPAAAPATPVDKLNQILTVLEKKIASKEAEGADVAEAKGMMAQAREAFVAKKFQTAKNLALQIKGKVA
jgi:pyruvate dehydrogenase E2 component (dihydrolipoamide acetyltransferase)